jgi:hypothetical protein
MMEFLRDQLFKKQVVWIDSDTGEEHLISGSEYVARDLENRAAAIRNMVVLTDEEWQEIKDKWRCPNCGSKFWDID